MSSPSLTLLDGVRWRGDPVTGERGHALLAALVLASPRAVGVGDLVDDVWADDEPEHPEKALQVLVSRTRARTAPEAVVHTGAGYRIGLREDEVDALRLRRLVVSAREGAAAGDLDVVRLACLEAVAIEVKTAAQDGPLGRLVAAAERDLAAAGRLLGRALLARGDSAEALPLLESALDADPADEQRLADVLRAEASVRGVPAALARYASYVERTRDALGAEPGEGLRRMHAELLARDAPVREGLEYDAAPMVGRDHDVARIRALLETSRVVSVVGPGGLGKTRMAHLVGRLAPQPVVHFVELAGVNAAEGVVPEVASALGVRDSVAGRRQPGVTADLRSRIAQHLAGPPTLLILDNCEHLVDEVASLVAFLAATTETTSVLTTSRAPLGIAAEQVYLLPQLDDTDAALLFRQRATAARRDVRLDGCPGRAAGRPSRRPAARDRARRREGAGHVRGGDRPPARGPLHAADRGRPLGAGAAPDAGGGDRLELEPARRAGTGGAAGAGDVPRRLLAGGGRRRARPRRPVLGRRARGPVARGRARGRRRALPAAGDGARVRAQAARRRRRDRRGPRPAAGVGRRAGARPAGAAVLP